MCVHTQKVLLNLKTNFLLIYLTPVFMRPPKSWPLQQHSSHMSFVTLNSSPSSAHRIHAALIQPQSIWIPQYSASFQNLAPFIRPLPSHHSTQYTIK